MTAGEQRAADRHLRVHAHNQGSKNAYSRLLCVLRLLSTPTDPHNPYNLYYLLLHAHKKGSQNAVLGVLVLIILAALHALSWK